MRAVLDPNVLIAAILSPHGSPATVLRRWLEGDFELIASEALIDELTRALGYRKLAKRVPAADASAFVALIRSEADSRPDPTPTPPPRSPDPGDDYLIALAEAARAVIVSGDADLLGLADQIPVFTPKAFLDLLDGPAT